MSATKAVTDFLGRSITSTDLEGRAKTVLMKKPVRYVWELVGMTEDDLYGIGGCNWGTVSDIRRFLYRNGKLTLSGSGPYSDENLDDIGIGDVAVIKIRACGIESTSQLAEACKDGRLEKEILRGAVRDLTVTKSRLRVLGFIA